MPINQYIVDILLSLYVTSVCFHHIQETRNLRIYSSCSIERKPVSYVCLYKGINSERRTGCPLVSRVNAWHLYSYAGEEKQKVHLSLLLQIGGGLCNRGSRSKKNPDAPSLRSTPTRRLIDWMELVLEICVTQACCHTHVRMQQAKWVKLV